MRHTVEGRPSTVNPLIFLITLTALLFLRGVDGGGIAEGQETRDWPSSAHTVVQVKGPVVIEVDASADLGEMPEVFGIGADFSQWGENFFIDYSRSKFLVENKIGINRLGLNLRWHVAKPSKNIEDYMERLRSLDPLIMDYANNGGLIYTIYGMPRWLSSLCTEEDDGRYSCAGGDTDTWAGAPPRDYDAWADLVEGIVNHYKNDLGLDLLYEMWNEPDQGYLFDNEDFWLGTKEEYLKLYKYTVQGAQRADQNVKIGGPATSVWDRGVIEDFIIYANGNDLPIDFITFHNGYIGWNNFDGTEEEIREMVDRIRGWLEEYHFDTNIPLIMDEWHYRAGFGHIEHNTEFTSSYNVYELEKIEAGGIDKQSIFHLVNFDNQKCFNSGGSGIICETGVIKPTYNSFRAVSILNGTIEDDTSIRLQLSINKNDFLTAIASQTNDNSKTRVLLSNFIPSGAMLNRYALNVLDNCAYRKGYTEDEWKTIKISVKETAADNPQNSGETLFEYIKRIVIMTDFPDGFDGNQVKQDVTECLIEAKSDLDEVEKMQTTPRQITLRLRNLPLSGKSTLSTYTIDRDHANSYRYNQATVDETGKGVVDRAVEIAREEARSKAYMESTAFLKVRGYSDEDIELLEGIIEECDGNRTELQAAIEQYYAALDRCKNDPECSLEVIVEEVARAYEIYREALDSLFHYGEYRGITLEAECIDNINNWAQVSLEGSKQQETITVSQGGMYSAAIIMQPYAVKLVEISSLPDASPRVRRSRGRRLP